MSAVAKSSMHRVLRELGPLRLGLYLLTAVTAVFAREPDMEAIRYGWQLITTLVVPALSPMVLMVLLFDMLMARVLMSDFEEGPRRARYRLVLKADALVVAMLLLAWLPFFLSLQL